MISALYVTKTSVYHRLPVDAYDIDRDARTAQPTAQVIAHPPCRAWGRLRQFAKPRPDEQDLARHAVSLVRRHGGVVEHPAHSTLWADQQLPLPNTQPDRYGGWTLALNQYNLGHAALKPTWLYIVGSTHYPPIPARRGQPTHAIRNGNKTLPLLSKEDRENTPRPFARWLIDLASRCQPPQGDRP